MTDQDFRELVSEILKDAAEFAFTDKLITAPPDNYKHINISALAHSYCSLFFYIAEHRLNEDLQLAAKIYSVATQGISDGIKIRV